MLAAFLRRASRQFRARRMRLFSSCFPAPVESPILDIGGTAANWKLLNPRPRVVLLNLPRASEQPEAGFEWVFADGCRLPFPDASFDVVFSNSVIEHVGGRERQEAFAREIRRVGRRYFVQTPAFWFPVEPHLLTPFLHWLPPAWQQRLMARFTVWEWLNRPAPDRREFYYSHYRNDIRLLTARRLQSLFPDACIVRERWMGLVKSLIAIRQ